MATIDGVIFKTSKITIVKDGENNDAHELLINKEQWSIMSCNVKLFCFFRCHVLVMIAGFIAPDVRFNYTKF